MRLREKHNSKNEARLKLMVSEMLKNIRRVIYQKLFTAQQRMTFARFYGIDV